MPKTPADQVRESQRYRMTQKLATLADGAPKKPATPKKPQVPKNATDAGERVSDLLEHQEAHPLCRP